MRDHVHAVGVSCRIAEMNDDLAPDRIAFQAEQTAMAGCTFGALAYGFEMSFDFVRKLESVSAVVKEEHGRDAVFVQVNMSRYTSCSRQGNHAALIRPNQCTFSGGHWDVEDALRVVSFEKKRAGNSYRNLRRADWILNVPAHLYG
jgi:hypothetical protein